MPFSHSLQPVATTQWQHDLWPELTLLQEEYSSVWDLPYTLIFTLAFVFSVIWQTIPHPHPHPDPQPQPRTPVSTYPCADLASCGMSVLVLAVRHRPLLGLFVARRYLSLTDSQHVKQRNHCRAESSQPQVKFCRSTTSIWPRCSIKAGESHWNIRK